MTVIAIHMEGGGDGRAGRAALRQGMNAFLGRAKTAAEARGWRWRLTACGGRGAAFRSFRNALESGQRNGEQVALLLVDSEGPVTEPLRNHLLRRDNWNLSFAGERAIHLMVQTMEAWIVADHTALAEYYGQGFLANALPGADDLEAVPKRDIERALDRATQSTSKGRYHKIHHARALLERIDPSVVRQRCPSCRRLFAILDGIVSEPADQEPPA